MSTCNFCGATVWAVVNEEYHGHNPGCSNAPVDYKAKCEELIAEHERFKQRQSDGWAYAREMDAARQSFERRVEELSHELLEAGRRAGRRIIQLQRLRAVVPAAERLHADPWDNSRRDDLRYVLDQLQKGDVDDSIEKRGRRG